MNKTYRVIFNHATGVYQCVSELAKAQGKSKSIKLTVMTAAFVATSAWSADYIKSTTLTQNPYVAVNDTINGIDTVINAKDISPKRYIKAFKQPKHRYQPYRLSANQIANPKCR